MMWLCTQRRSPWPCGAMPRDRRPSYFGASSVGLGPFTGTVGGAGADAAAATAASVLANRAPPPPNIDWAPLLLPKTKRLLSSGSGRSVFMVVGRRLLVGAVRGSTGSWRRSRSGREIRRGFGRIGDARRIVVMLVRASGPGIFFGGVRSQLTAPTGWKLWG